MAGGASPASRDPLADSGPSWQPSAGLALPPNAGSTGVAAFQTDALPDCECLVVPTEEFGIQLHTPIQLGISELRDPQENKRFEDIKRRIRQSGRVPSGRRSFSQAAPSRGRPTGCSGLETRLFGLIPLRERWPRCGRRSTVRAESGPAHRSEGRNTTVRGSSYRCRRRSPPD